MFICSSSFFAPGSPSGLQHSEFIPHLLLGALQEHQQAEEFLREPSGRRLAIFLRPQASLPRTTKDKPAYCCTPIIDGEKILSRTPKCYLWRSWAHDPEESKINPLLRARERQANREPSLVVGRGHISWLMLSLLALKRQKQLAKSSPLARHVSSKTAFLEGTSYTSVPSRSLRFFCDEPEMVLREATCEIVNVVVRVST
jgi:hypothetical protein